MRHVMIIWDFGNGCSAMLEKTAALLSGAEVRLHLVAFLSSEVKRLYNLTNSDTVRTEVDRMLQQHPLAQYPWQLDVLSLDDISDWVVAQTAQQSYDLVVKAGHRSEQLFYTPTDWQLIRTLQCPLLLTTAQPPRKQAAVLAAVDLQNRSSTQQQLNVAVSGFASRIARHQQASLHLVQVLPVNPVLQDLDLASPAGVLQKSAPDAIQALTVFAEQQQLADVRLHVLAGQVDQQIRQLSHQLKAGLVVLGSIGRQGLAGALLGNTAEQVLQHLHTDVLIIKPA